jgi:hypothetical protein
MQRVYNETVGASAGAAFFGSGAVLAYSRTDVKPSSERESLYKTFPKNHSRNRTVTATLLKGVSPTKVRKVPQDFCQQSGREGFSANPELP